ncbi:hypothetical protein [Phenylobacterium sp.]|uniref:hypothetical protein n=1 Tax=Phenylobacterium sp. TaxID=1871053 RepID=UPI0012159F7B|nr:hypothetical protein [Phenylobacterium sp.]TAL29900.1 MAG: hypothetical protein EPN98_19090 [Phenylobacterium sp.]
MTDETRRDSLITAAAIGLIAYVLADVAHHLFGHAAACLALGGQLQSVTSIHVACSVTGAPVDLAGPAANLAIGVGAWLWAIPTRRPRLRLFLLLCAAFNLLWLEGQLVFSAAARQDDWDQLILALTPRETWRWVLIAIGAAAYVGTVHALAMSLRGFAAPDPARLKRLMLVAYAAGGVAALATGLRDPGGLQAVLRQAGPQALLLPLGLLFIRSRATGPAADAIRFSAGWLSAAVLIVVASVVWLGPGLS